MSELVHLTSADARRVPWRNGRGVTEELAIHPEGASFERGDFDWRVSKASVAEPGPFSSFPGFDRVIVVTDGDGLVLSHGGAASRGVVGPLDPYPFDGAWPTSAELTGGAVRDFNVLTRRGRFSAVVSVVRSSGRVSLAAGHGFAHVLAGDVAIRVDGEHARLVPADSAWIRDARDGDMMELDVRGDCVVLFARIAAV